jgi:DNA-directed RNA polymerase specialized sigma24 family protein
MGDATSASQPRAPARLQPGNCQGTPRPGVTPAGDDLLADADAALLTESEWLSGQQRDAARRAAESLSRRSRDLEMVNALALAQFEGPAFEVFAGELAAYGYPVILAWLRRGTIWRHCAERGRPLYPTDAERETLEGQFDERLELALETVAEGLKFFRERVLLTGRWSFEGGATITTYFIGACLLAFPNVFRRWHAAGRRWNLAMNAAVLTSPEGRTVADLPGTGPVSASDIVAGRGSSPCSDPADVAGARSAVLGELRSMPPGTRDAAALVIDGRSFAETAAAMGTTDRAVEGRLYRYRKGKTA